MRCCWSQEDYKKALRFAAAAHEGQTLPDGSWPYVVHVVQVAMEVMAALAVEEQTEGNLAVVCALLHDVLEDTPTGVETVREIFGDEVVAGVMALSKNNHLEKPLRMADSLRRIRQQPQAIWMVKLADRITNLDPPPSSWTREKIHHYRQEAREILQALHPASAFLARRLEEKILHYGQD